MYVSSDFKPFRRWSSSWISDPSGWALLLPGSSIFIRCEYRKIPQKNSWHLLGWRMRMAVAKLWLKWGTCTQTHEKPWRCGSGLLIEPFFNSVSPALLHASLAVQPGGWRWNRVWQGIGEQLEAPSDPQVALKDTKPFSAVSPFYKCKGRKQKAEKEKKARENFEAAQAEMMPDTQEVDDETPEELEGDEDDKETMEAIVLLNLHTCMFSEPWDPAWQNHHEFEPAPFPGVLELVVWWRLGPPWWILELVMPVQRTLSARPLMSWGAHTKMYELWWGSTPNVDTGSARWLVGMPKRKA